MRFLERQILLQIIDNRWSRPQPNQVRRGAIVHTRIEPSVTTAPASTPPAALERC